MESVARGRGGGCQGAYVGEGRSGELIGRGKGGVEAIDFVTSMRAKNRVDSLHIRFQHGPMKLSEAIQHWPLTLVVNK